MVFLVNIGFGTVNDVLMNIWWEMKSITIAVDSTISELAGCIYVHI